MHEPIKLKYIKRIDFFRYKLIIKNNIHKLEKIKLKFIDKEQQLFIANFYCYLNYNSHNEFIIDFNNIWKWLGFTRKGSAKTLLLKNYYFSLPISIYNHMPFFVYLNNNLLYFYFFDFYLF